MKAELKLFPAVLDDRAISAVIKSYGPGYFSYIALDLVHNFW